MLNKLAAFLRQQKLVEPGEQVICAVSGGADSMALLYAMYLLQEKLDIRLAAAHFNHNLRGAESDGDEAFVRAFCARNEIPLYSGTGQVVPGKKGLEAAAREARYAFFDTLPGKLATAHTADDNAETVLLHLVRGTGLRGLGGIAPVRGRIIRPMLGITRQEVLAFLEEYHIPFREDSSNGTDRFLRNRLRHHVLPLLKEENPRLAENLSAMALRLRLDEQALEELSAGQTDVAGLRAMAPALRSRALERFLKENGVREPECAHIAQAEALVMSENPSAHARFPGGVTVSRQYDRLVAGSKPVAPEPVELKEPGVVQFGEFTVTCQESGEICNTDSVFSLPRGTAVTLRSRQPGDTLHLSGGTKTLKKLFIDKKIPAARRSQIPVLADERGVVAVFGLGIDPDKAASELPVWKITVKENHLWRL